MSSQEPPTLQLKPIISYPREAQVGKTYLVSIDVQLAAPNASWDFPEEEYTIGFILNTSPYFTCEPLHDVWPTIILHRYGGTYGPAEFLLTAADHEIERGQISITLVNGWGIPMTRLELPCEVRLESGIQEKQYEIPLRSQQKIDNSQEPTTKRLRAIDPIRYMLDIQNEFDELEKRKRVSRIATMLTEAEWHLMDITNPVAPPISNVAIQVYLRDIEINARDNTRKNDPVIFVLIINSAVVGFIMSNPRELIQGSDLVEALIKYPRNSLAPFFMNSVRGPLLFMYEMQGEEIRFTNNLEPEARTRTVFHFHRPETFALWLEQALVGTPNDLNDLLRSRLRRMPPLLGAGLRDWQFEAITNLERSLAENRPRALIHMASGTGKTYMAVSEIYRLLRYGGSTRILFLVDRNTLGQQAFSEFQQFVTPDSGQHFTDLYNVQLPSSKHFDPSARVCIITIQRLYSILQGEDKPDQIEEDVSSSDRENENEPIAEMQYHPTLPIEYFDVIFIDECHRSIYGIWRPIIEYFDAFLIGMTAFPTAKTFAFFQRNLVMEYSREQALVDGTIVDYDIYRIRTELTEQGSRIEQGIVLPRRNKQTRGRRYEELKDDLVYEGSQISQDIVVEDQIRMVLTTFRDNLPVLFPERTVVPKTVIFARDNSHAEDIVNMVREVFGEGNNFVKKITYSIVKGRPEELIYEFCNAYNPRIVVTVTMLLGVDILPLECIILMRPIRSAALYEQILGLGSRTIQNTSLQAVTPDARSKAHFILVDTVGATYNLQSENSPLDQKPFISLERLLTEVVQEHFEADYLTSLAARLSSLNSRFTSDERVTLQQATGYTITELAHMLLDATNIDKQIALAKQTTGLDNPDDQAIKEAALQLAKSACRPYTNQELCATLLAPHKTNEQVIDDISIDRVIGAQFDNTRALQIIADFDAFLGEHRDLIEAFKNAYSLRSASLLVENLEKILELFQGNRQHLTIDTIWHAYRILDSSQVHVHDYEKIHLLPDIMAIVCYSLQRNTDANATLELFEDTANLRFVEWLHEQQKERETAFSDEQVRWLERIRDRIASSLQFEMDDFDSTPFSFDGGSVAAHYLFRSELEAILQDLNTTLVFGKPTTQEPTPTQA